MALRSPVPTAGNCPPKYWLNGSSDTDWELLVEVIENQLVFAFPEKLLDDLTGLGSVTERDQVRLEALIRKCAYSVTGDDFRSSSKYAQLLFTKDQNPLKTLILSAEFKKLRNSINSQIKRGADRDSEFDRLFAPYLNLSKKIAIYDPWAGAGLLNKTSAINWLLNTQIIPRGIDCVIHTKFSSDTWIKYKHDSYGVLEEALNENLKPNTTIEIKLYRHEYRNTNGTIFKFPHDRFWAFFLENGAVRFNLGQGIDLFDTIKVNDSPSSKLKGESGFYAASQEDISAIYSPDFARLLSKSGRFEGTNSRNGRFKFSR